MANMNKRDSDSKKYKTVINVRTPLSSGGDKDTRVHTGTLIAKGTD